MTTKTTYIPYNANIDIWKCGLALTNDSDVDETVLLIIKEGKTGRKHRKEVKVGANKIELLGGAELPTDTFSIKMESSEHIHMSQLQLAMKGGDILGFGCFPIKEMEGNLGK